jgi:Phage integrase, N-terminal SAM-like domain
MTASDPPHLRIVDDPPASDREPAAPFFLIVADHDQGVFAVEGPMTDDQPWSNAARHARDTFGRHVTCGPTGPRRARRHVSARRETRRRPAGQHRPTARMTDQLPAVVGDNGITAGLAGPAVPALIAAAGDRATIRFLEFFAANIRNSNTRRAYRGAVADFLVWCEAHQVASIAAVQPLHVAAWVEQQTRDHAAPTVKLRLAALRHLFDWLVTGQVWASDGPSSLKICCTRSRAGPGAARPSWLFDLSCSSGRIRPACSAASCFTAS